MLSLLMSLLLLNRASNLYAMSLTSMESYIQAEA